MKVLSAATPSPLQAGTLRSTVTTAYLALVAATFFWAGGFVAGRALRDDIGPITLNFLRWLMALGVLTPFVAREMLASAHVLRREWRLIAVLGATGIAAFHTMTYVALSHTTALNALLSLSLVPVLMLLGENLIGRIWPSATQIAGALVSVLGAVVLIARGDVIALGSLGFNRGDLWMLGAVVVWAAYSLLLRRRPDDLSQPVALTASIVVGLAILAPVVAVSALLDPAPAVSVRLVVGIGYVAVFGSVIAFLCWSYGVAEIGAGRAGQFVHLMPMFGAILSAIVLNETVSAAQAVGAACVLVGIGLVNRGR
jgi:drug/metabolite transporter (DMT)-like permease